MNVRLVYVGADHKGMIAFGKTLGKFHTQPVSFFRGNLTGPEGLAHMIGNHIIRTAHSSGSGNVLPLCQKEFCVRNPAVTRITGNKFAVICFLWICYIVDDVTDCPTFCAPLANMKRHDSCSCHNRRPSSHKYFFAELFASIVAITFSAGYNKKEHSTTSKEGFYDRTAHCRSNGM